MMTETAADLLAELTRRGIEMVAQGDRLRYRPKSAMTLDLADRLKRHKPDLLAILRMDGGGPRTPPGQPTVHMGARVIRPDDLPTDWRELYEERAAIREYDGEQPRPQAEAGAWRDVMIRMDEANIICLGIKNVISLR